MDKDERAKFYYEDPAYYAYPVVNITQEAARLYCRWLADMLQARNPDFKADKLVFPAPAESFMPNGYGLSNMSGNVAEMLQEEGRTKGGSYKNTGFDIRIDAPDTYAGFKEASPYIGFRVLLSVVAR